MSHWSSVQNFSVLSQRLSEFAVKVPASTLRMVAYVFVAVWFLLMLSDLFWSLIPVPDVKDAKPLTPQVQLTGAPKGQHSEVDVETLKQWSLFGLFDAVSSPEENEDNNVAVDVNEQAKETRLSLELMGVVKTSDPSKGSAMISHQSKSDLYKVGDKLPGGRDVSLSKVLTDRVIIDNRGAYESLLLWDLKIQKELAAAAPKTVKKQQGKKQILDKRQDSRLSALAGDYRKQLLSNPMSLSDVIKVSIAKDSAGEIMGYRVRPGRHRKQFEEFGLKSGDIITAVNGTQLNDPAQAMQLYGQLRDTTDASFDIKRGNEELTLMISLGDG